MICVVGKNFGTISEQQAPNTRENQAPARTESKANQQDSNLLPNSGTSSPYCEEPPYQITPFGTCWHGTENALRQARLGCSLKAELLCPTDERSERHTEGRETETQSAENPRPSAPRAALCALLTKESTPELLLKYYAQSGWMLSNTMHKKKRVH